MKFQVGDKVLVLHSNEEGEVVEIINNKMVMVDVRGVKFPAYIDQLDFPYYKRFTEKKLFPQKKEKQYIDEIKREKEPRHRVVDGVWLSFLPVIDVDEFGDDVVDTLKIHLINHTERTYQFLYRLEFFGRPEFDLKNELHAFHDFYLHDVPFGDLSDSPNFHFGFSLLQPNKQKAEHFEVNFKLKPKQLFARLEEMKTKGAATFTHKLFDEYPDKIEVEKIDVGSLAAKGIKVYNAREALKHLPPPRTVVDLHIEKLADDWKHLSNAEILDIQLKEFEKWYDIAIAHRQQQFIVIHGVGTGRLRDEIHDLLRLKREVKTFVNQYHPSFGYGATEIYFQF